MEMELMDWKTVETNAEEDIRASHVQIMISSIMLEAAQKKVKALGGETNEEINKKAKQARV